MLSDTCLLSRKRLSGPLFKAEIPEIGMAFGWVHLWAAGGRSWEQQSHGWAGAVTVHIHYDVLDEKDAERVGDNLTFLYFQLQ